MQNPIWKFKQSFIVFEKPGILSENLKTLTSSNYPTVQYFLLKLRTRFLLTNVYKLCVGFFLILFRSSIICKNKKRPGFYTLVLYIFINNSRSKQNKKNPEYPFLEIIKWKTCAKFQQKNIKLYGSWSSSKFSIFQAKKPTFLEIADLCLDLGIRFCITWLVLPNYKEITP